MNSDDKYFKKSLRITQTEQNSAHGLALLLSAKDEWKQNSNKNW